MKKYLKPECEITKFTSEDILVASGVGEGILTGEEADYNEIMGPAS